MTSDSLSTDILTEVAASPHWFPHAFDPASGRVLLVGKSEEDYRAASFLDQRSLLADSERTIVSWEELARAVPSDARADAHYIFHIGHVGSTLISRLLGEVDTILALREPLLLRTFAELQPQQRTPRLDTLSKLLSRTFRPDQRAIVKATSFTSEIASLLVPDGSRALFLYATPQHYIEGILAGDASRQELQMLATNRQARLGRRCGSLEPPPTEAALAAHAWACEMTSLEQAAASLPPDGVMWVDFDRFLEEPARHLGRIAGFFGVALSADAASAICAGPLMRRYSKALEYEYNPQLRRDVLADARAGYGPAIRDALQWLERAGRQCPILAQAISRAS